MKNTFIIFLSLMAIMTSCSKEEKNAFVDDGSRYPVSESELSPAKNVAYYFWEDYSNSSFITYYSFYLIPMLDTFSGFKGTWDDDRRKTVAKESYSYSITNSILTLKYSSFEEVFVLEKAKNRPLQDGDRVYLNNIQYRVQISDSSNN